MRAAIATLLTALVMMSPALAQDYPTKPIKVVVPSPPGATTDAIGRIVADKLQKKWGQPVIVDDRGGAGGNLGGEEMAKASPDGYTLLFTFPSPLVINKSLYTRLNYDPDTFEPVGLAAIVPLVLAVNPKVEAGTLSQLIALAKAQPNQMNYASQGYGTTGHLAGELFKAMAGVEVVHVPYKGSAPALTDLLAGQTQMMFIELSTVLPNIRAGALRALAMGSETRNHFLPDVPTVSETLPGFAALTWFGMVAPPKTPKPIVNRLSAAMAEALHQPDAAQRLTGMSADIVGSTPEAFQTFLQQERQRWGKVIHDTGARAE